jgi:hypothetical protein
VRVVLVVIVSLVMLVVVRVALVALVVLVTLVELVELVALVWVRVNCVVRGRDRPKKLFTLRFTSSEVMLANLSGKSLLSQCSSTSKM